MGFEGLRPFESAFGGFLSDFDGRRFGGESSLVGGAELASGECSDGAGGFGAISAGGSIAGCVVSPSAMSSSKPNRLSQ